MPRGRDYLGFILGPGIFQVFHGAGLLFPGRVLDVRAIYAVTEYSQEGVPGQDEKQCKLLFNFFKYQLRRYSSLDSLWRTRSK